MTVRDRQEFAQRIMAAKDECEALKDTYAEILQVNQFVPKHHRSHLQVFLNAHQVTEAQVTIDGSLSALQQQCRRLLRPPEGESTKVSVLMEILIGGHVSQPQSFASIDFQPVLDFEKGEARKLERLLV